MLQMDTGGIPDADTGSGFDRNAALDAVDQALQFGRQSVMGGMGDEGGRQQFAGADSRPIPYSPNSGSPLTPRQPTPEVPGTRGNDLIKSIRGGQRTSMLEGDEQEQSFAEGGPVEEDYDPEGDPQAAEQQPAIPADGTVAGEYSPQMSGDYSPRGMQGPHVKLRNAAKGIMAYLMGSGAAPASKVAQLEQQADPEGTLDPNDRKLAAVQAASQQGPEQGWAVVQHYRRTYDAYKAHGAAALARGDLTNAANSLTQAYTNLPDGYSIKFTPDVNGVRADMMEGDKLIRSQNYSPQQLAQFIRSPQAAFDQVLSKGSINTFGSLSAPQQQQAQAAPAEPQAEDPEAALEARSRKIFPWVSQESQRQRWIAEQLETQQNREAVTEGKVGAAAKTAEGRVEAAKVYAGGREKVARVNAKARLLETLKKVEASASSARERNQASIVRQALQSAPLGLDINQFATQMKGQGVDISKWMGAVQSGQAAPAPSAGGQPQQPASGGGQQQGDRFWRDQQGNIIGRKW